MIAFYARKEKGEKKGYSSSIPAERKRKVHPAKGKKKGNRLIGDQGSGEMGRVEKRGGHWKEGSFDPNLDTDQKLHQFRKGGRSLPKNDEKASSSIIWEKQTKRGIARAKEGTGGVFAGKKVNGFHSP